LTGPKFRDKCNRILFFIAVNGPVHKAQIEKSIKPNIDHPTIHKAVNQLLLQRLIHLSGKKNPIVRYYDLTRAGLLWIIRLDSGRLLYPHADLAEKYRDLLPEIFSLWPNIVHTAGQFGAENELREKLERYSNGAFEEERRKMLSGKMREANLNRLLGEFFLDTLADPRWRQALLHERELTGDSVLKASRRRIVAFSKEAEGFLEFFEATGNEAEAAGLREALRVLNASFHDG